MFNIHHKASEYFVLSPVFVRELKIGDMWLQQDAQQTFGRFVTYLEESLVYQSGEHCNSPVLMLLDSDSVSSVIRYFLIWLICRNYATQYRLMQLTCFSIFSFLETPRLFTHDDDLIFDSSTITEMFSTNFALRCKDNACN